MLIERIDDFLQLYRQKHPRRKREIKFACTELTRLVNALGNPEVEAPSPATAERWRRFLEERIADCKPARRKKIRRMHRRFFEYVNDLHGADESVHQAFSFLLRRRRPPADASPVEAADPLLLELRHVQMLLSEQSEMLERTEEGVQSVHQGVHALAAGAEAAASERRIDPQELFPALDELQAALDSHRPDEQSAGHGFVSRVLRRWDQVPAQHDNEPWQRGVSLIRDRLLGLLEGKGVVPFGKTGEVFDPGRHVALAVQRQAGVKVPVITRVIRCGYRRDGVVLRYAEVEVSAGES